MQVNSLTETPMAASPRLSAKIADCLVTDKNKTRSDWTLEQLQLQPYQHLLEVGFNSGNVLREIGRKMPVGFLAGVDESVENFQMAYRKNKKLIQKHFLQLHLGSIGDLPYPPNYFHTIFSTNKYADLKEPQYAFMQLANMLRPGGRLITVFQPRWAVTEKKVWLAAQKIQDEYLEAGLTDVRISFRDMSPVSCISTVGVKS